MREWYHIQSLGENILRLKKQHDTLYTAFGERMLPPPFAISPPPGEGGGHFTLLRGNIYWGGLCSPSITHVFLPCFPIALNQSPVCIFEVILALSLLSPHPVSLHLPPSPCMRHPSLVSNLR